MIIVMDLIFEGAVYGELLYGEFPQDVDIDIRYIKTWQDDLSCRLPRQ